MSVYFGPRLLAKYPIISDQVDARELTVILGHCQDALINAPGDVVEMGCYMGTTSLFLSRLIKLTAPERQLHVYDSFVGLPAKTVKDRSPAGEHFVAGKLRTSKSELIRNFKKAGLPLPVIRKGWFDMLEPQDLPDKISFAFLDGDYYESVRVSLDLVWPKMAPGGTIIVDDYHNEALPGAKKAVDEWTRQHAARVRSEASLAVILLPH